MCLIVQLLLPDNITIHLDFLLQLRDFSSLEMCRSEKRLLIWSQIYMNCSAVSHPQPEVQGKVFTWLKFMPPLLQWSVTGVCGLCLEKQRLIFQSRAVCVISSAKQLEKEAGQ